MTTNGSSPLPGIPDLVLHVKREYYDQILARTKTEEYRLFSPYWIKRLLGKNYALLYIVPGYPKNNAGALIMPYRGCEIKDIQHPHFGPDTVRVFAIKLTDEQRRDTPALS